MPRTNTPTNLPPPSRDGGVQWSRRLLLQSAAAAAAMLAVGACAGERAATGDTTTTTPEDGSTSEELPSVALVGDSISFLSRAALEAELADAGFGRIDFDALPGRRILEGESPGVTVLDAFISSGLTPDLWIIELGTNDLGKYAGAPAYAQLIETVLQRIPPPTPLVWVDTYSSFLLADSEVFNDTLRGAIENRGDAAVADWYAKCVEIGPATLIPDGLHPVAEGFPIFAEVTVAPVDIVA
jgi:hypothetical protein